MTLLLDNKLASRPQRAPARPAGLRVPRGGLVDRTRPLAFTFDGRGYAGLAGDTLASALLANGVRLVGRSFKYHRPRGVFGAGSEEPNALVELRAGAWREPNTRATMIELFDGLEAGSQNRWPSLRHDAMSLNGVLAPVLAAGFYYKTFMWPARFWEKVYEPAIRRAAGLGRAAGAPDPDHYETVHAHCDVLVIGAGPAGLAAALAAARSGARVILVDEQAHAGGRLLCERREIEGRPGRDWARAVLEELDATANARVLTRTTLFGAYDHGQYGAIERVTDHLEAAPEGVARQRYWRIVARRSVLAAGAIERPHVFGGNDRPGVMMAGAVRAYINKYAVLPGRRVAVYTSGDDGWRTVRDVLDAGAEIVAAIDTRREIPEHVRRAASGAGVRIIAGAELFATNGHPELSSIDIVDLSGRRERIACDCLAMANGWNPVVTLDSHLGRRPIWNEAINAFVPAAGPGGMVAVGAAAGHLMLAEALADGSTAGAEAAEACGFAAAGVAPLATDPETAGHVPLWRSRTTKGKAFVDFQNDVAATDVELAHREGFRAVELLKRYTTLGMATDQGKTSNVGGLSIMAELTGQTIPQVGTTLFRPPFSPVCLGALAGRHRGEDFRPTRLTPSHRWAETSGARFVDAGAWKRAAYFPRPGEKDWLETVEREVTTVRTAVGLCDVSTFGKIDLQGRDAIALIEMAYGNAFGTLPVGRARYAVMLREDGFVMDDGTVARLGEEHFVATTSTIHAGQVMRHLAFIHQWLRPDLDVRMASVSEQWAQFAVAGPRARDTLRAIVDPGFDLDDAAFPFLACAAITVGGGIEARLFRISFSGELAYELAIPARFGEAAWSALLEAGARFGITPYGTEALGVMRVEKGHVAGAEINGQTTARDLGLGGMLARKKDYVGRLLKERPALTDPDRPILVGIKPVDGRSRIRAGGHFVGIDATPGPDTDEGYLTSAVFSPTVRSWIGLGLLKRGAERHGQRVRVYDPLRGSDVVCAIGRPCFVDPEGERLRG